MALSERKWRVIIMFMGEYNHTIDPKNRIIVPIKLRDELGEKFVISEGFDGCLYLSKKEDWENFCRKLLALPGNYETRTLQRRILSTSMECEPDKQGRIIVPTNLKNKAKLEKDIVMVGIINRVEIWSKDIYEGESNDESLSAIMEKLSEKYDLQF